MKHQSLLEQCRTKLLKMREEYGSSLDMTDLEEWGLGDNLHHADSFRSRYHFILPEIDLALERIDNGSFGICEITGKPIEDEKLLAIPWTRISMMAIDNDKAS